MLNGKKIALGITGSIAAYKIPQLIRLLKKGGAEVKVIMTPAAHDFVTPLTLSVVSENPVLTLPFNDESGEWNSHVELGKWADIFLITPLSANTLSKMATGQADNLLLTTYLSTTCPVFFAPAMDLDMYQHSSTTQNIKILQDRGDTLILPASGELASGLCGEGRMEEPEKIVKLLIEHFKKKSDFINQTVLITAGPTHEAIDPVRYISNKSSGKMGYALAKSFAQGGAEVILISGPVDLTINHPQIKVLPVVTAKEMLEAVVNLSNSVDIFIMAAAVSDFSPTKVADQKIKKGKENYTTIALKRSEDILATIGASKRDDQLLVGFALETENEYQNAIAKLRNKNADLIVLNSLRDKGAGFGTNTNKITVIDKNEKKYEFELKAKTEVAADLTQLIHEIVNRK